MLRAAARVGAAAGLGAMRAAARVGDAAAMGAVRAAAGWGRRGRRLDGSGEDGGRLGAARAAVRAASPQEDAVAGGEAGRG
jgi:hypothetical protein